MAQRNVDSLWGLWNDKKQADTVRLQSIHVINRENYLFAKPDSSFILAQKQYVLAKSANSKKWMAEARNTQGISFHIQANYIEAIEYYNMAIKIATEINDKKSLAGTLNNIGIIYKEQGDAAKAIDHFEQSLAIKEEIKDTNGIANSLGNIGSIYIKQGKELEALKLFERGLKISKNIGNRRGEGGFLNNIGSVYLETKEYSKALKFFEQSIAIRIDIDDKKGISSCYKNMALVHQSRKEHQKAIEFGKKALKVAQKSKLILEENEAAFILFKTFKEIGKYQQSLKMHELYVSTNDSLKNKETQSKIIQQEFRYQYQKKYLADSLENNEIQKLKDAQFAAKDAENKHNELLIKKNDEQTYYLYGILGLALLFGAFIFNRFKITQRQKNTIQDQKHQVDQAFGELEVKNKEIMDSINYAKRIQTAMLPSDKLVKEYLQESFILYKPKDIVAGDFYWMETKDGVILFAAADCTGHGVPGAMVSVVCNNGLNRSVREHGLTDPGQILDRTREIVIEEFEKSQNIVTDGMDIALCTIKDDVLKYAGANNSLWIVRSGEIIELKADKQPIGKFDNPKPYNTSEFKLQENDSIYAFTDGYVDQFGGENDKKFMSRSLKELILSIQSKSLEQQKNTLNEEFEKWKGDKEQVDDVCVIGVKYLGRQ